ALSDRLGREFTAADAVLLQSFADQAALALENARLYEETERRRREAEVVAEVARGLNAALDLDTVLQRVTAAARDLCDADLPLITAGDVGGLLYVDRRTRRPFSDRDESVLMQLADHAAVALTNARLYAAAGDRAARLRTLNRLNHLVSSSLDTAEVLTDIARA